MLKTLAAVSTLAVLAAAVGGAGAQSVWLAPTYGTLTLTANFIGDPRMQAVMAGGPIDSSQLPSQTLAPCAGFIASAPSYRLNYTAGTLPLIISAVSTADTVLVINDPSKRWFCADDTTGNDPAVTFDQPRSGQYDVWVGTFGAGPAQPATVFVSEIRAGRPQDLQAQVPQPNAALDPAAAPGFGQIALTSGFAPDPLRVAVQAGGTVNAAGLGANCTGFTTRAPTYRLTYVAGVWPLFLSANAAVDTTIVVNLPDGTWRCNDDQAADNFDPRVQLQNPPSGTYEIWIGTFTAGALQQATLQISEVN